ncbi:MAG TPA: hypothetical protein VEA69_14735 [Tepidisphaeraceae bacterium]|nr:hypothetical protein [Tepidisphaeraceae bacterium]
MSDRPAIRVPLILLVSFLLTLFGGGFLYLAGAKADRTSVEALGRAVDAKADKDAVKEIQQDVRDLRNHFLGPRR